MRCRLRLFGQVVFQPFAVKIPNFWRDFAARAMRSRRCRERIRAGNKTCQGATAHGRACLSFRYSVAAPMPSLSAAFARLPPEACSAAAM